MIARFLTPLQQALGLTGNEVKVVLFLCVTFLFGLGVRWYLSSAQSPPVTAQFDYSDSDAEFAERSTSTTGLPQPTVAKRDAAARTSKPEKTLPALQSININTAGKADLIRLPGIGETYAARIILYRDEHGKFESVDDLQRIKGIGKKTLERIRPFVRAE